jgi:hypothetical protein
MSTPSTGSPVPPRATRQTVTSVQRWTHNLWSLHIDRPDGFGFAPGHYAKLGLPVGDDRAVWRPYSIVSAEADDELEFLIVLIPGGAFSAHLESIEPGRPIMLASSVFGFFLEPQLSPGDTLWMLATGTGLGPYVSLLRTPGALDRYRRIIVAHSVRLTANWPAATKSRHSPQRPMDASTICPSSRGKPAPHRCAGVFRSSSPTARCRCTRGRRSIRRPVASWCAAIRISRPTCAPC